MNKFEIDPKWKGPYDEEPDCKFNPAVGCDEQKGCATCGWNPDVAKARSGE